MSSDSKSGELNTVKITALLPKKHFLIHCNVDVHCFATTLVEIGAPRRTETLIKLGCVLVTSWEI